MSKYREALEHIIKCDRQDGGVSNLSDAYRNDIGTLMELVNAHEKVEKITCESTIE